MQRCKDDALDLISRALDAEQGRINQPVKFNLDKARPIRINIGAGPKWSREGWVILDKFTSNEQSNVINCDLLHRQLPHVFGKNCVDRIFSSHVIEHFTFTECFEVLTDCYSILKPGGSIRLVTPDLDILTKALHERDQDWFSKNEIQWGQPKNINEAKMSWNFLKSIGVCMDEKYNRRTLREVIRGTHYSAYNFSILNQMMTKIGFVNITKCQMNQTNFHDYNGLDERQICSLYVEAIK